MALSALVDKLFDPYDRVARLYPALLAVAPLVFALVCLYGTDHIPASTLLGVLGGCGAGFALARFAREAGKRQEAKLWAKWGGAPTTQFLRHGDQRIDRVSKRRIHAFLSGRIGAALPTEIEEQQDAHAADELYRAATAWLIGRTRDTKRFSLLFKENIAYGFQRNAYGLRRLGAFVALVSLAWSLAHVLSGVAVDSPHVILEALAAAAPAAKLSIALSLVSLLAWGGVFTEAAVRRTGDAYAERLLRSCDQLESAFSAPDVAAPAVAAAPSAAATARRKRVAAQAKEE